MDLEGRIKFDDEDTWSAWEPVKNHEPRTLPGYALPVFGYPAVEKVTVHRPGAKVQYRPIKVAEE